MLDYKSGNIIKQDTKQNIVIRRLLNQDIDNLEKKMLY